MSFNEPKTMNRAKNHARSASISLGMSVQTTVSHKLRHGEDTEVLLLSWQL